MRILQFGDSHTASDLPTKVLRHALQERFGSGGRGFLPIGAPWKNYWQEGVLRVFASAGFSPLRAQHSRAGLFTGDGRYGPFGVALSAKKVGEWAAIDVTAPFDALEVAFLSQPGGGRLEVLVDHAVLAAVSTRNATAESSYLSRPVPLGPHRISVRSLGGGEVRIFGATLTQGEKGVLVDALGVNGARVANVLEWDATHFEEQVRHARPALVIVAYGTNESMGGTPPARIEEQFAELLARLLAASPQTDCLLLGPPDRASLQSGMWQTAALLPTIDELERRVAAQHHCAYFSQFAAMGGASSMAAWAVETPPRAQGDRVHLTRSGYATMGQALASHLLEGYQRFRQHSLQGSGDALPSAAYR